METQRYRNYFEYYFRLLNDYSGQSYSYPPTLPDTTNTRTCPCSKYLSQGGAGSVLFLPHTTTIGYLRTLRRCNWSNGSGQEYGGGFNFYPKNNRQSKFTFEALYYNRSPANNASILIVLVQWHGYSNPNASHLVDD